MVCVKICGLTNRKDAVEADELADYLGVVVEVPVKTPRNVDRHLAKEILSGLGSKKVAVVMPKTPKQAIEIAKTVGADIVQVYDDFSPEQVKEIKKELKVLLAFNVKGRRNNIDELGKHIKDYDGGYDYLMLDSGYGTGKPHNWNVSREIKKLFHPKKFFLAGGLTPENVAIAIKKVRPYAVDVSSGVERKPGKKSFEKMRHFNKVVKRFRYEY